MVLVLGRIWLKSWTADRRRFEDSARRGCCLPYPNDFQIGEQHRKTAPDRHNHVA